MPTDYDAPRTQNTDEGDQSLEDLTARRREQVDVAVLDVDDGDAVDAIDLPDIDLSGEELMVRVVPKQANEFTCSSCFLVHHRNRLALQSGDRMVCSDYVLQCQGAIRIRVAPWQPCRWRPASSMSWNSTSCP
jgi:Domain of unknown function (DUF4193)